MSITPFPLPIALTPADRKALRARAHHLDPVVMIGDAGLSRAVLAEADRALGAHELIKIRVLGDDRAQRQALLTEICSALGCAPVQSIGKLLVVYRPKPIEDTAAPKRPRGPHLPKKLAATGATARRKPAKARKPMKAMKVEKAAAPAAKARKGAAAKKPARGAAGKPEPVGTRGKRTAIGARARVPAHHGDASSATQGPTHLAGRSGQASKAGTRARAKKA
ncbi:MAG TPA: YhbY family RNA-binding protein [Burkholderiaceae bacterium]|nr:YhbY family RNA-binding protein [Burkholderiaceae bacterium]